MNSVAVRGGPGSDLLPDSAAMRLCLALARREGLPAPLRRIGLAAAAAARTRSDLRTRLAVLGTVTPPPRLVEVPPGALGPIWIFWAEGEDAAPAIVRASIASIRRHAAGRDVLVLSAADAPRHVGLPEIFIARQREMGWTAWSDALRLCLLARHGGTWIDANVLLTAPMPAAVAAQPLALPARPHQSRLVGSWFIHARAGHPFIAAWRDALAGYWRLTRRSRPYYHLHTLAEALVLLDAGAADMIARAASFDADPCLRLKRILETPFDRAQWETIAAASWIHKLTHRTATPSSVPGTVFQAIETGAIS